MMKTRFLVLALAAAVPAWAQVPATNPMPDGSHDLYLGLGVVSAPKYEGAHARRTALLPVLQLEWSNGAFVSGLSAGMHLAGQGALEYGPLLALDPGRDASGTGHAGGVDGSGVSGPNVGPRADGNRLAGMETIGARLQGGAFLNAWLSPQLRLTGAVLAGGGRERDGLLWRVGAQYVATGLAPQHRLSVQAGATVANRAWMASWFGVSADEARRSANHAYAPGGGLKDVYAGVRWNWALSPSWMLVSNLQATRLAGDARHSPLAERPSNVTVSTALAYRF